MKGIYIKIMLLLCVINMIMLMIFIGYKIDYEKALVLCQQNEQEAMLFRLKGEQLYAKAMAEKEEAERCRKEYYSRVFYYDENGNPCSLYAEN